MSRRRIVAAILVGLTAVVVVWAAFRSRGSPVEGLSARDVAEIERLVRDHQRPGSSKTQGVKRIFAMIGKVFRRRSLPEDLEIARKPDGTVSVEATPWRGQPGDRAASYYLDKTAAGWRITSIHYSTYGTGGVQFPGGAVGFAKRPGFVRITSPSLVMPKIEVIQLPTTPALPAKTP